MRKNIAYKWSDLRSGPKAPGRSPQRKSSAIYLRKITLISLASAVWLGVSYSCTIHKQTTINITIMAKKQKQFYTKWDRHEFNSPGETNNSPSQTSQGEAVSMAEMIRRYTAGDIPPLAQSAFYGHDVDIDQYEGSKPMEDPLTEMAEVKTTMAQIQAEGRTRSKASGETSDEVTKKGEGSEATQDPKAKRSESEGDEPATKP